ncbi:polysaccharide deacetylase family protein [Actinacidiphila sp. bgisy167]|uniref:polysaccharide deacetylase family protein n=1 Tax=Actinacidiphila sp. bgisy167 TaxID=3413797 RepID=UPI003D73E8F5
MRGGRELRRAALAGGVLAAGHVVPAATWLPGLRRRAFPALAGLGRPDHVALTFDDGPDPVSTPRFLDALDELGVRATFFVLGAQVEAHPRIVRDAVRRGHEIAVHGWTHDRPWLPEPARERAGLARAVRVVRDTCGVAPLWYRPPYGILTGGRWAAAGYAGLTPVLWSAWGRDWTSRATAESVLETLRPDLRAGATVLLHDSDHAGAAGCWRATLAALPALTAVCRDAGLRVGTLAEHGIGPGRSRTPSRSV